VLLNKFSHDKRLTVSDMVILQGFKFCSVKSESEYFCQADEGCCVPGSDVMRGAVQGLDVIAFEHESLFGSFFRRASGILCLYEISDSGNVSLPPTTQFLSFQTS